uniref:Large ribosomal subunit protein bL20c n=1 Tax=Chloropicon maureeniae TaxID=1461542 RepID=A0A4D6C497_9CHLO|nr:ribosomal protein L20 [Chloropicon maureeniae]QBX98207.1 ribosomal protein L20 [Chloropicon maureeniae]
MTRVKRGSVARKRRRQILKSNKGARGSNSKLYRPAQQHRMKALRYAYVDRRLKKREARRQWIVRCNSATRFYGVGYSTFIHNLAKSQVRLNRKVLAQLAMSNPEDFKGILQLVLEKTD